MTRPELRINLVSDYRKSSGGPIEVDFNYRLHWRGLDFTVDAAEGYSKNDYDAEFTAGIMDELLDDECGITLIKVRLHSLSIKVNTTMAVEEIMARIMYAATNLGYDVVYRNLLRGSQ